MRGEEIEMKHKPKTNLKLRQKQNIGKEGMQSVREMKGACENTQPPSEIELVEEERDIFFSFRCAPLKGPGNVAWRSKIQVYAAPLRFYKQRGVVHIQAVALQQVSRVRWDWLL